MKRLQILGTGCQKCRRLAELTQAAADELGIAYELEKVTDINDIMKYDIMMTPGLVVDGVVKCAGTLPSAAELKEMLS
ncbi:MAG: thioredoxin family protein [Candidatus Zixiibacteriota bacterium]